LDTKSEVEARYGLFNADILATEELLHTLRAGIDEHGYFALAQRARLRD
jgi:hypothetical protein